MPTNDTVEHEECCESCNQDEAEGYFDLEVCCCRAIP